MQCYYCANKFQTFFLFYAVYLLIVSFSLFFSLLPSLLILISNTKQRQRQRQGKGKAKAKQRQSKGKAKAKAKQRQRQSKAKRMAQGLGYSMEEFGIGLVGDESALSLPQCYFLYAPRSNWQQTCAGAHCFSSSLCSNGVLARTKGSGMCCKCEGTQDFVVVDATKFNAEGIGNDARLCGACVNNLYNGGYANNSGGVGGKLYNEVGVRFMNEGKKETGGMIVILHSDGPLDDVEAIHFKTDAEDSIWNEVNILEDVKSQRKVLNMNVYTIHCRWTTNKTKEDVQQHKCVVGHSNVSGPTTGKNTCKEQRFLLKLTKRDFISGKETSVVVSAAEKTRFGLRQHHRQRKGLRQTLKRGDRGLFDKLWPKPEAPRTIPEEENPAEKINSLQEQNAELLRQIEELRNHQRISEQADTNSLDAMRNRWLQSQSEKEEMKREVARLKTEVRKLRKRKAAEDNFAQEDVSKRARCADHELLLC